MAHTHKRREGKIKAFQDLPRGRAPGDCGPMVQKSDYPKLLQMSQEGYLMSEIGRAFGVRGSTASKLIKRYEASL